MRNGRRPLAAALALLFALLSVAVPASPAAAQGIQTIGGALKVRSIDPESTGEVRTVKADPDGFRETIPTGEIAARCGGFFRNIVRGVGGFFRNLLGGIFGGIRDIFGGGGGGGTCGNPPGDDGGDTPIQDPPQPPVTTTPGTPVPPVPDGEVPAGVAALKSAIKAKFGVTMAGGWSEASLKAVYKTLSVLPENFRKWNRYMERGGNRGGLLGLGQIGGQGKIWIYGGAFSGSRQNGTGIATIVHEMTHNFQGNGAVMNAWSRAIRGRSVSSYGNTNSKEDMAESVTHYYLYPERMKQTHASRYEFIKNNIMGGREFTGNEWK